MSDREVLFIKIFFAILAIGWLGCAITCFVLATKIAEIIGGCLCLIAFIILLVADIYFIITL